MPACCSPSWSDLAFALSASCTATVSAALNLGLLASVARAAPRHPVTAQLCACGILASAALACQLRQLWAGVTASPCCRALALAALFSHCAFVTLSLLETRLAGDRRGACIPTSIVAWCSTALVTLAGVARRGAPSTSVLLFCLYVLHVPIITLLVVHRLSPRSVSPQDVPRPSTDAAASRTLLPRVLLFFASTLPQALLTAAEALPGGGRPLLRSAEAWGCPATALFAALRPPMDALLRPELGDAVAEFVGLPCRRRQKKADVER